MENFKIIVEMQKIGSNEEDLERCMMRARSHVILVGRAILRGFRNTIRYFPQVNTVKILNILLLLPYEAQNIL